MSEMYRSPNNYRSRLLVLLASTIVLALGSNSVTGQYTTVTGQNDSAMFGRGVLTSPEVGDLEGIQRFGESLRTDPDVGVGYTYRVFPTVPRQAMDQESFLWAFAHVPEVFALKAKYEEWASLVQERQLDPSQRRTADGKQPTNDDLDRKIVRAEIAIESLQLKLKLAFGRNDLAEPFSRYAPGRNPIDGLRSPYSSTLRSAGLGSGGYISGAGTSALGIAPLGIGAGPNLGNAAGFTNKPLYHQPLIQIKVRLIEATRRNSSDFRSVLDYISRNGTGSLVQGNNINANRRSTRAATRLPNDDNVVNTASTPANALANISTGSGALVNLTAEHINLVTNMLVTEFRGDVLTVPEVTTLNGQNVEFVAGANRPLPLGLTTSTGNTVIRQDVFYKHIGTLVSITPRIVNWGKHLEGNGEAPLVAQEIENWNRLAQWMSDPRNIVWEASEKPEEVRRYSTSLLPVPFETKKTMLAKLEKYPAKILRERLYALDAMPTEDSHSVEQANHLSYFRPASESISAVQTATATQTEAPTPILRQPSGSACDWKPEDCTIDLEILVRESNLGDGKTETANSIANIIQVKSGHGAVMGGLIGTSEIESLSKIPLLGDLPAIGFFFRSKSVDRAKSELLILVEASVLPNDERGRATSANDFRLARAYVDGEMRDNPLECGMWRAGFGEYLPPSSPHEDAYWCKHSQKLRKVATEIDDTFK